MSTPDPIPKRPRGRPPGKPFPCRVETRLTERELAALDALAKRAGVQRAEMVRRIVRAAIEGEES